MVETHSDFDSETFSTFGTGSKAHIIDQLSEDMGVDEHGFHFPETSSQRLNRSKLYGPVKVNGEVAVPLYTIGTPTLLHYLLGKTTTTDGSPNSHVIENANTVPAFRMAIGKDKKEHRFMGCAMKSCTLDFSLTEPATATFDIFSRKELAPGDLQSFGGSGLSFPDYNVKDRSFLATEVGVKIGGEAAGNVRGLSLTVTNNIVEDTHTFGDRYQRQLIVQGLEVTGNITLAYDDIATYNYILNEESKKIELEFDHGTGATSRSMKVEIPTVAFTSGKLPTDGKNEYILETDFTAEGTTDGEAIKITVENEETNANLTA